MKKAALTNVYEGQIFKKFDILYLEKLKRSTIFIRDKKVYDYNSNDAILRNVECIIYNVFELSYFMFLNL